MDETNQTSPPDERSLDERMVVAAERQANAAEREAKAAESQDLTGRSALRTARIAIVLGVISLAPTFWSLTRSNRVAAAELVAAQLTLTSLTNGAKVGINELVHGATPFPQRNHYVVVTPLRTGESWVQALATLQADNTWTGNAQFGSGDLGINEKFTVRCLATEHDLQPGPLASQPLPSDAVFSPAVTVTRTY